MDAADCIRSVYGNIGSCFRIGGDEFVVLLRNLSREEVQKTFTVLEEKIERMNRGRKLPLKIAWGYAVREKGSFLTGEELFEMADADMYRKKQKMKQTEAG